MREDRCDEVAPEPTTTRRGFARSLLGGCLGFAAASACVPRSFAERGGASARPFGFDDVVELARRRAGRPWREPPRPLPAALRSLTYDQYREIRFRPDRSLWRGEGLPCEIQFFHPGFYYLEPVALSVVAGSEVEPVEFQPSLFDYGRSGVSGLPAGLGFAGFRVHAPINRPDYLDEVIVFLGASYFRAVGRGQVYGLSARGVAIDMGLDEPEEFPAFRAFWIERPAAGDRALRVVALLDGPSVAGAYRFEVRPGLPTVVGVTARLFFRREVRRLGLAPLTSMFLFGEEAPARFGDYRPEVHDSDGLLLVNGTGERLFRPLRNPAAVTVTAFELESPRGFGLVQRDRIFDHYQDLESSYQARPSAWVEPEGDWGRGEVLLLEIPSDLETTDNIGAFWVPERRGADPVSVAYRVSFGDEPAGGDRSGRAVATRIGRGRDGATAHVVLDFDGPELRELPAPAPVELVVTARRGEVDNATAYKNTLDGSWRAFFDLRAEPLAAVDLRAFLRAGDRALTETWTYLWSGA